MKFLPMLSRFMLEIVPASGLSVDRQPHVKFLPMLSRFMLEIVPASGLSVLGHHMHMYDVRTRTLRVH